MAQLPVFKLSPGTAIAVNDNDLPVIVSYQRCQLVVYKFSLFEMVEKAGFVPVRQLPTAPKEEASCSNWLRHWFSNKDKSGWRDELINERGCADSFVVNGSASGSVGRNGIGSPHSNWFTPLGALSFLEFCGIDAQTARKTTQWIPKHVIAWVLGALERVMRQVVVKSALKDKGQKGKLGSKLEDDCIGNANDAGLNIVTRSKEDIFALIESQVKYQDRPVGQVVDDIFMREHAERSEKPTNIFLAGTLNRQTTSLFIIYFPNLFSLIDLHRRV